MRVVVCLKIRVSAAFCVAQENKINMFQDSLGYSFISELRHVRSKQKSNRAVRFGFHQRSSCYFDTFATLLGASELLQGSS